MLHYNKKKVMKNGMARPRVFVSSTFYDLRQVRADIEKFIRDLGYEPIMHEIGVIPYGKDDGLENYCYREVTLSDIIVNIIGGRFGSQSVDGKYSITQQELKTAIETGKQVYIFIDKVVDAEYLFWKANKDVTGVIYQTVDDVRVFAFIDEIRSLPKNNQIVTFETAQDIIKILREQWAGLFQSFLRSGEREAELLGLSNIMKTSQTLSELVDFIKQREASQGVDDVIIGNHPVFHELAALTSTPYRVYFLTIDEMELWLKARSWTLVVDEPWDNEYYIEYFRETKDENYYLHVHRDLFNEEKKLVPYDAKKWSDTKLVYIKTSSEYQKESQEDSISV